MKLQAVASAVAAYQSNLEKAYKAQGIEYVNVISALVQNYANMLLQANDLVQMEEIDLASGSETILQ